MSPNRMLIFDHSEQTIFNRISRIQLQLTWLDTIHQLSNFLDSHFKEIDTLICVTALTTLVAFTTHGCGKWQGITKTFKFLLTTWQLDKVSVWVALIGISEADVIIRYWQGWWNDWHYSGYRWRLGSRLRLKCSDWSQNSVAKIKEWNWIEKSCDWQKLF